MYAFLIDECLSPRLADYARKCGYDAQHVNWLARNGAPDHALMRMVNTDERVMVTNNAVDFIALYRKLEIHPGLIVIVPSVRWPIQLDLFGSVLRHIATLPDCINKLIEVDLDGVVTVCDHPALP